MPIDIKTHAERPRYFPRQVITADDLTLEQDYFRDRLRRHNRLLHGWGIVCGVKVEAIVDKPWIVKVNPGYILGPYGDEIHIEQIVCCDLRIKCTSAIVSEATDYCTDSVTQVPPAGGTFFVVARYREDKARPVRLRASGCDCGENPCEYSRWRDSYDLCVLDVLPASHHPPSATPTPAPDTGAPDCPPMPLDPWVVLAAVKVTDKGVVDSIDFTPCDLRVARGL